MPFVIDEHVLAPRHMAADSRDDFVLGGIGRDDTARNLPFTVDPFDDPASATERLLQRRGDTAPAQMKRGLGPR
ncbi:hypothetical protein YK56LOC_58750 [Caballeronia sp. HLA56]